MKLLAVLLAFALAGHVDYDGTNDPHAPGEERFDVYFSLFGGDGYRNSCELDVRLEMEDFGWSGEEYGALACFQHEPCENRRCMQEGDVGVYIGWKNPITDRRRNLDSPSAVYPHPNPYQGYYPNPSNEASVEKPDWDSNEWLSSDENRMYYIIADSNKTFQPLF